MAATRDGAAAWAVPADDDQYFAALLDYAAEDHYLTDLASKRPEPCGLRLTERRVLERRPN